MSLKDFQVISKLGEGSYSCVYKVKRLTDSQEYALKKVKLTKLSDKEKQNALDEVRILASIQSPYLISYKEAFIDEASNALCIVVEYADDGDLFSKIGELAKNERQMEESEIWEKLIQVVQGLKALHDLHICHRDLKSANIFLNKDGTAKIGDMNVSKVAKTGFLHTQTGTPYYASPEVWRDQPYDMKSDIWSLGCVVYEMASGKTPFRAEDLDGLYKKIIKGQYPKLSPRYSQELQNVIRSMLQVSPSLRPNCDKILQILAALKKMKDKHVMEPEELSKNILLSTILFPKNLNYLTQRLPKANYTPSRTRMRGDNKFIHTIAERNLRRKDDSLEDLISRGSESFDHSEFQRKAPLDRIGRDQSSRKEDSTQNDKPKLSRITNPVNDYLDKYTNGIESEISKIKKQLEARRLKDDEDRKRLDILVREKELKEREINNQKDLSLDYKYHNISYDVPYDGGTAKVNSIRLRADLLPEGYAMSREKSQDTDESSNQRTPEKNPSKISPIYKIKPKKPFLNENSPFRSNLRGRGQKGRIGLHALARNMKEKVGEEFIIPDIPDLPRSRLSKLPPVNRQQIKNLSNEGSNKSPSLSAMLSQDAAPMIYLKQKLIEIVKQQGNEAEARGGADSVLSNQNQSDFDNQ